LRLLAVFAVEEVADGGAAGGVGFVAFIEGVDVTLGDGLVCVGGAAGRAAIGETWLVGLELEFFGTDGADFDRKSHYFYMISLEQVVCMRLDWLA
jgi:hypothetical protein